MKKDHQKCTTTKKDVIRVKAKKYETPTSLETKTFSLDPELTNFATLQEILIKAFNIKEDFAVSYLVSDDRSIDAHYLPMQSDWDFNTAVYAASEPYLVLKVDMRSYEEAAELEEWNIIEDDYVTKVSNTATRSSLPTPTVDSDADKRPRRRSGWFIDRGGGDTKDEKELRSSRKKCIKKRSSPMTESVFNSYLDAEGRLLDSSSFQEAVYQSGLDPSIRRLVWPHLLNVYPDGLNTEERSQYEKGLCEKYDCLKESWQRRLRSGVIDEELRLVANSVRKDVIRTDRTHPFFAGDPDHNENILALFNILTTYALAHPEVSYCQGMSDLASPILNVIKEEGLAYACFCALMKRMRDNFSCDGWAMTRKFHHLSELVHYYDPTFYEYLREMHSEDLLFAYRWLLLELKREFTFDDVLVLMEVTWASLPSRSMDHGCESDLYDIDLTAVCGNGDDSIVRCQAMPEWTDAETKNDDEELTNQEMDDELRQYAPGRTSINTAATRFMPVSSPPTVHSCPGIFACSGGVCPALVVRSLMLDYKENKRLHELRHASYPTRPFTKFTLDDASLNPVTRRGQNTRITIGCWSEDLRLDVPVTPEFDNPIGSSLEPIIDDCSDLESSVHEELSPSSGDDAEFGEDPGAIGSVQREDSNGEMNEKNRSCCLRPSPELRVSDSSEGTVDSAFNGQPVPMAMEAYLDCQLEDQEDELTLTRIHEICLANIPMDDSAVPSSKSSSSACASRRSREPSGGNSNPQQPNTGFTSSAFTVTDISQFPTRRSSVSNAAPTTTDSGIFECPINRPVTDQLVCDPSLPIDINEFVNVDRDPTVSLPPPHELGDGNPFTLFVCLALILQHRNEIMKSQLDFNDIAVYFDQLMRKHDMKEILDRARILYANYLPKGSALARRNSSLDKRNSCMERETDLGISKAVAVCNTKYIER